MLPTAHFVPAIILERHPGMVQLQCHQELLPLQESGPGYCVFAPVESLPETLHELDWPSLLTQPVDRDSWVLPRTAMLRVMTPEGTLAGFPVGDPFDLEPEGYTVDWTDGELVTLTLERPLGMADFLGPDPPTLPTLPLVRVAYELPEELAREAFAAGAHEVQPGHWRYRCWALAEFPFSLQEEPPTLPHLAVVEEPFDTVEHFLVADEDAIAAARAAGWDWQGELWRNPLTGARADGVLYAQFRPVTGDRVQCEALHLYHLGHTLTAMVPFGLEFADPTLQEHRWVSNLPFPALPPE